MVLEAFVFKNLLIYLCTCIYLNMSFIIFVFFYLQCLLENGGDPRILDNDGVTTEQVLLFICDLFITMKDNFKKGKNLNLKTF